MAYLNLLSSHIIEEIIINFYFLGNFLGNFFLYFFLYFFFYYYLLLL